MSEIMTDLLPLIDGDVNHSTECALWKGEMPHSETGQLHGRFWFCKMAMRPYRLLYDLNFGIQARGLVARHMCLSKGRCCNLKHLKMGTRLDNYLDRFWQTDNPVGPRVTEVIPIYAGGKNPAPHRIPATTVYNIRRRKTWKSILADTPEARVNRIKYSLPEDLPKPFLKQKRNCVMQGGRTVVIDDSSDDE